MAWEAGIQFQLRWPKFQVIETAESAARVRFGRMSASSPPEQRWAWRTKGDDPALLLHSKHLVHTQRFGTKSDAFPSASLRNIGFAPPASASAMSCFSVGTSGIAV